MRVIARPVGCCPPQGVPPLQDGRRDARLLRCLRAAADPTRLQVLRLLSAAAAPACVCDVTSRFRLSQPTISHHLRILRQAGLVTATRRGIWAYYSLRAAGLAVLRRGVLGIAPRRSHDKPRRS